eukprot:SAG11_NODE_28866_length_317_cov_0.660550_1_plen_24_part_01
MRLATLDAFMKSGAVLSKLAILPR